MADFEKAVSNAFHFAADRKRIGFLATFYLFFLVLAGAIVALTVPSFIAAVSGTRTLYAVAWPTIMLVAGLLVVLAAFVLAGILVSGAFVYCAGGFARGRRVGTREGVSAARWRFLPLVGASVLAIAISIGFSIVERLISIPFALFMPLYILWQIIAVIIGVVIGLAILFVDYEVMLAAKGAVGAVVASIKLFARKPLETAVAWLIGKAAMVVSVIIGGLAALVFIGIAAAVFLLGKSAAAAAVAAILAGVAAVVFIAAVCFAVLFNYGILASVFLQIQEGLGRPPAVRRSLPVAPAAPKKKSVAPSRPAAGKGIKFRARPRK